MQTDALVKDSEITLRPSGRSKGSRRRTLELNWAESEWFQVWLQLARHEVDRHEQQGGKN